MTSVTHLQPRKTVQATVLMGGFAGGPHPDRPVAVEIDGAIYHPDTDQEQARAAVALDHVRDEIAAHGVPDALINALENGAMRVATDAADASLRRIGWLLVHHGQHELWRLAFLDYMSGSSYTLGDETRFLLGRPAADSPAAEAERAGGEPA